VYTLLKQILSVPLEFDFVLYKHGPFFFDLRDELTALRATSIVDIEIREPYGPSYRLGPSAHRLMERFPKSLQKFQAAMRFVAREVSIKGVADLERIATAIYVDAEAPNGSLEERVRLIQDKKPHITGDQAKKAVQEAEYLKHQASRLGLVQDP